MAKAIIGISCDLQGEGTVRPQIVLDTDYFDAVRQAGGLPVLIPFLEGGTDVGDALAMLDGLLLSGGGDLDPSPFGQELHPSANLAPERRRRFDLSLARAGLERGMPVLGICMGMQLINLVSGGTLIQDLPTERPSEVQHRELKRAGEVHPVNVARDSHLAEIVGTEPLGVNSTHHQAVGDVAAGFRATAHAPDGVIEAIERVADPPVVAVQWHPERMLTTPRHPKLFEWLVAQAGKTRTTNTRR